MTTYNPEFLQPGSGFEHERRMQEVFTFELDGAEYVDYPAGPPTTCLVPASIILAKSGLGKLREIKTYDMRVTDPFVHADALAPIPVRGKVAGYVDGMERLIQADRVDVLRERQGTHPYQDRNSNRRSCSPYTERWTRDPRVAALEIWQKKIPSPMALGTLCLDELLGKYVTDNHGNNPTLITPEAAAQLRFVDDSVAIRDRAAAMIRTTLDHLLETFDTSQNLSFLSLACGTAEPAILAAQQLLNKGFNGVDLHALDLNQSALDMVKNVAKEHGYGGGLATHTGDLFDPEFLNLIRGLSGLETFNVVECLGFMEYLPNDDDSIGASLLWNDTLPQASDFIRNSWELVAPGGIMISGNMALDRPQRDFVFGVVCWPIINARSDEELLSIYAKAGILDDPRADVTVYRVVNDDTDVCIYNLVTVTKKP